MASLFFVFFFGYFGKGDFVVVDVVGVIVVVVSTYRFIFAPEEPIRESNVEVLICFGVYVRTYEIKNKAETRGRNSNICGLCRCGATIRLKEEDGP